MNRNFHAIRLEPGRIVAAEVTAAGAAALLDKGHTILLATESELRAVARRHNRPLVVLRRGSRRRAAALISPGRSARAKPASRPVPIPAARRRRHRGRGAQRHPPQGHADHRADQREHGDRPGLRRGRPLVAGVGTGGTITGVSRFIRHHNPEFQALAVEPADSPVISGGKPGPHKIQGIGAGFIPKNLDTSLLGGVETVTNDEAFASIERSTKHVRRSSDPRRPWTARPESAL
jgi:hypothetical protein